MWPDTVSKSHHPYRLGDDLIRIGPFPAGKRSTTWILRKWLNIAMFLIQHIDTKCIYLYIYSVQYTCIQYTVYMYFMHSKMVFYRCIPAAGKKNQRISPSPVCFELRMWSVYIAPLPSWDREWRSFKTRPGPIEKWDPYPGSLMIVGNQEKYENIYMESSQSELIPVGWCKLTQSTPLTQTCDFVYWTQFIPTSWPTLLSVIVLGPGPPRWC